MTTILVEEPDDSPDEFDLEREHLQAKLLGYAELSGCDWEEILRRSRMYEEMAKDALQAAWHTLRMFDPDRYDLLEADPSEALTTLERTRISLAAEAKLRASEYKPQVKRGGFW